ncbi:Uu.00g040130.m01.CDS01 [Anthostomella pinea]|uniref:Pre-rRNA-processing protein PNO1 n=1 Tax=Anthostomella pinea TaxID=933095 RepID=A0AAI8VB40_9PEZI|nr:Uu.00g040130.m01.CDS01 [Anthostomella pinea]
MPAPTAMLKQPLENTTPPSNVPLPEPDQDEEFALEGINTLPEDTSAIQPAAIADGEEMEVDEESKPRFAPTQNVDAATHIQSRKVLIPPNRFTPLKNSWPKIYPPLVEHLQLQVRMNVKHKRVELRTSKLTTDPGALQKGADFIQAFALGFDLDDAIALLRLDDLFIQSFDVKDVKNLTGDHLARAIGRVAGHQGKTKFAIENTSKTRIVLADSRIHILGAFKNIGIARETVVSLILGAPPGKVYNNLRTISSRMKERF